MPGWWMNEGGQSSTGQLIDFMIKTHPAYPRLEALAEKRNTNIHEGLLSMRSATAYSDLGRIQYLQAS